MNIFEKVKRAFQLVAMALATIASAEVVGAPVESPDIYVQVSNARFAVRVKVVRVW